MDTAPTADRPKPKSRWFRYRLPATLIVVAAVIGTIWLAVKIKQAHAQRAAVAAILKAGGQVAYEDQDDLSDPAHKPRGPEWLRSLLGDDALVSVTRVDLSQAEITDADCATGKFASPPVALPEPQQRRRRRAQAPRRTDPAPRTVPLASRHRRLRPGTPQGIDPTPLAESGRQQNPWPRAGEPEGIDPLGNPRAQRYGDQRRRPGTPARIDWAPLPLPRRHRGQRHRAEIPQGIDAAPPCTSTVVGSWGPA